jgi:hypothetical protein
MPNTFPKTLAKSSTKTGKADQKSTTAQLAKKIVGPGRGSKVGGGVKKATATSAGGKPAAAAPAPTPSPSTSKTTTKKVAARRLEISPEMEEVVRVIAREEIAKHWKRVRGAQAAPKVALPGKPAKAAPASKKATSKVSKSAAPKTEAPRIPFTNQIIEAVLAINPVTRQASRQDVKTHIKAHHPSMNPETIDKHVANALKVGGEHHLFLFPKGPSGRIMVPMASLNKKQVEVVQAAKQQQQQTKTSQ